MPNKYSFLTKPLLERKKSELVLKRQFHKNTQTTLFASSLVSTPVAADKGKKRGHFLPHNRPVKKKGANPLRPGVQGFFLTCDGGRERQASHEAIYVLDSFYEELVHGNGSDIKRTGIPNKSLNKKILFASSRDDEGDNDNDVGEEEEEAVEGEEKQVGGEDEKGEGKLSDTCKDNDGSHESLTNKKSDPPDSENVNSGKEMEAMTGENKEDGKNNESQANEAEEPPIKKQYLEADASKCVINDKAEVNCIDKLIEAELKELGDKNMVRELASNLNNLPSLVFGSVMDAQPVSA